MCLFSDLHLERRQPKVSLIVLWIRINRLPIVILRLEKVTLIVECQSKVVVPVGLGGIPCYGDLVVGDGFVLLVGVFERVG